MSFLHDIYGARGRQLPARTSPIILGDKAPYLSPMDGKVIDGRTQHKEHMRQHGVVEAGDMKMGSIANIERAPMDAVGPDIQRAIQELASR